MDLSGMLFDVGDRVAGVGEIRVDDDGVWLDPPHFTATPGGPPGRRHPRSSNAVHLHGYRPNPADVAAVAGPHVWGTVTGVWTGGGIADVTVSPSQGSPPRAIPAWTDPPCPPPPGGWPSGNQEDLHHEELQGMYDDDNIASRVHYRPRPDSMVLVIAVTDVAAAEARWRPVAGDRLCIVASRWSKAQLDAVTDVLLAGWDHWAIIMTSRPTDDWAQSHVDTELLRVTADLAGWAARLPDGILEVRPTLTPAAPG